MTSKNDVHITADELHAMLKMKGLTVSPNSPLVGLPAASVEVNQAALTTRGLVTGEWAAAMTMLQEPGRCVRVLKTFPDQTVVQAFYGDGASDGLVGCWPEDGTMRIGFPYSSDDLLKDGATSLGVDLVLARDPITAELSPAGLAALASAIDVMRQRLLRSILDRNTDVALDLRPGELHQAYADGLACADARWIVTLMHMLMPVGIPLPEKLSDAGMAELTQAGFLDVVGDHWQATDALARLTAYLKNPLPAVAHEAIVMAGEQVQHYAYVIAIRGDGPAWTFQFWQEEGRVGITFRSRLGGSYRRLLLEMLEPVFAQAANDTPAVHSTSATEEKFCTECGAAIQPGAAFCSSCGQKL